MLSNRPRKIDSWKQLHPPHHQGDYAGSREHSKRSTPAWNWELYVTHEELSFSNITCFMFTPLITILRWFFFFAKLLCNFFFVRGALLQLTATRVGSWETKSCKAWREYASTTLRLLWIPHFFGFSSFFSPRQLFSSCIRGTLHRESESLELEDKELQISRRIWSRWHQDKRPRCPSLPGLASPRLRGGSSRECT